MASASMVLIDPRRAVSTRFRVLLPAAGTAGVSLAAAGFPAAYLAVAAVDGALSLVVQSAIAKLRAVTTCNRTDHQKVIAQPHASAFALTKGWTFIIRRMRALASLHFARIARLAAGAEQALCTGVGISWCSWCSGAHVYKVTG